MPPAADVPNVLTPEQGYEATYRFVAQYYERERIVPLMLMLMPLLDLSTLIGLSPDDAVAVATDAGFQDVRVLEFVDDELIGAMDMSLRPNRLNLEIENWRVRRAVFGS
jgi:hypothetical protein